MAAAASSTIGVEPAPQHFELDGVVHRHGSSRTVTRPHGVHLDDQRAVPVDAALARGAARPSCPPPSTSAGPRERRAPGAGRRRSYTATSPAVAARPERAPAAAPPAPGRRRARRARPVPPRPRAWPAPSADPDRPQAHQLDRGARARSIPRRSGGVLRAELVEQPRRRAARRPAPSTTGCCSSKTCRLNRRSASKLHAPVARRHAVGGEVVVARRHAVRPLLLHERGVDGHGASTGAHPFAPHVGRGRAERRQHRRPARAPAPGATPIAGRCRG